MTTTAADDGATTPSGWSVASVTPRYGFPLPFSPATIGATTAMAPQQAPVFEFIKMTIKHMFALFQAIATAIVQAFKIIATLAVTPRFGGVKVLALRTGLFLSEDHELPPPFTEGPWSYGKSGKPTCQCKFPKGMGGQDL
jgi:hypothetical protein